MWDLFEFPMNVVSVCQKERETQSLKLKIVFGAWVYIMFNVYSEKANKRTNTHSDPDSNGMVENQCELIWLITQPLSNCKRATNE